MKKKLILVAPLLLSLFMASCGTSNSGSVASISNKEGNTSEKQTVLYTVTFANTSLASIQIEAGKVLSKPADPVKANSIFTGWYLDSNLTQLVSFPLVINNDTTIYAGGALHYVRENKRFLFEANFVNCFGYFYNFFIDWNLFSLHRLKKLQIY